jgi:hypothetical protein
MVTDDFYLSDDNTEREVEERDADVAATDDSFARFFNKKLSDIEQSGSIGLPMLQDKDYLDENGDVSIALKTSKSIAIASTGSFVKVKNLTVGSSALFGIQTGSIRYKGKLELFVSHSMRSGSTENKFNPLYYSSPIYGDFVSALSSVLLFSSSVNPSGG